MQWIQERSLALLLKKQPNRLMEQETFLIYSYSRLAQNLPNYLKNCVGKTADSYSMERIKERPLASSLETIRSTAGAGNIYEVQIYGLP